MTIVFDQLKMFIDSSIAAAAVIGLIFSFYWNRKILNEMKNQRFITSRPILSQKIDVVSVTEDQKNYDLHFYLKIKNYGLGTAFNQTFIEYIFYHDDEKIQSLQSGPIMGAYDNIASLEERELDLSIFFPNIWKYNPEGIKINNIHCNLIEIRIPYDDINGNKCCSCTKYTYDNRIRGLYGKIERYNWFSASNEFTDDRCKNCERMTSLKNDQKGVHSKESQLWIWGILLGLTGNILVSSTVGITESEGLKGVLWYGVFFMSAFLFGSSLKKAIQVWDISSKNIDIFTIVLIISGVIGFLLKYLLIPSIF